MPRLLCESIETFHINGRGTVVVLEDPPDWRIPRSERVHLREAIRILRPDRSSIRTFIKDLEFMRKFGGGESVLIMLPFDVSADAVPAGSMIFLERDGTEPILCDGFQADFPHLTQPLHRASPHDLSTAEPQPTKGEQGAGANRRGFPVVAAFRDSNPPSRLHAHPRPGGRHCLIVRPNPRRIKFSSMSKRPIKLAIAIIAIIAVALVWLYIFGWTSGHSSRYAISKLELYHNPTLVAIHLKDSSSVFLVRNASGKNEAVFLKWISSSNADITSMDIIADSIYSRWSNITEDRDTIQFGIHGHARGTTRPTFEHNNEIHVGIAQEDFVRGSFSIVSMTDFAKLKQPKPSDEFLVFGNLVIGTHHHFSFGPKPRKSPGP